MQKKLVFLFLLGVMLLALAGCQCLWAWTVIYANRDVSEVQQEGFVSAKDIYICAGESALLKWDSSNRFTQLDINREVGEVNNSGQVTVSPTSTAEYTITAQGEDCTSRSTATVHVVQPGDPITISAQETQDPSTKRWYWLKETKKQIYSPAIMVNSIRVVYEATEVAPWTLNKIDPNGEAHTVEIPEDIRVTPDPKFSIVGTWELSADEQYQGEATFELLVECQ